MGVVSLLKKNIYIRNILLMAVVFVVIVCGVLLWLNIYTQHGESILVPNIKGMGVAQASVVLENANLSCEVVDSISVKNARPGTIVESVPDGGTRVKPGRIVFLTICSFDRQTTAIPDVKDLSQRQALAVLSSRGFTNVQVQYVNGQYKNIAVGLQRGGITLFPGEKVPGDTRLVLLVSNGKVVPQQEEDSLDIDPGEEDNTPSDDGSDDSWF